MKTISNYKELLEKTDKAMRQNVFDSSSDEDLSIAIMNLISIEEHLFFTSQKTGKSKYLDLLNEIRLMRTDLMRMIIKDYEGEVWCISKHLLSASMRVMEVGTKELKKGNKDKAQKFFDKSFKLYSLFWGVNMQEPGIKETSEKLIKNPISPLDKLASMVKKALDCCKE